MAKRFIDTDLFRKPFMRGLEAPYKALWIYLLCECDHAGIWTVELDVAQLRMGMKLDPEKAIEKMGGSVVEIDGGKKWFLPDFVTFQYGTLNPANRVHESVLSLLSKFGIDPNNSSQNKGHLSPLQGAMDKDKVKVTLKEKERAPEVVLPWQTDTFAAAWSLWKKYKAEKGAKYKPIGEQSALKKLSKEYPNEAAAIAAIENSMAQNYQGIFPPKSTLFTHGPQTDDQRNAASRAALDKILAGRSAANGGA